MPAVKNEDRCWFTYADGRRCRSPKVSADARLCFDHWQREEQLDDARKSGDWIVAADNRLETAEDIHRALGNLFRLASHGRLPARQATALAYIGNLMIYTLPHIRKEHEERDAEFRTLAEKVLNPKNFQSPEEWREFMDQVGLSQPEILMNNARLLLSLTTRNKRGSADLPSYSANDRQPIPVSDAGQVAEGDTVSRSAGDTP